MNLSNLQKVMYNYICENKLFSWLIPYSSIATMIYGIYSLLYNISSGIHLLNSIMNFIWIFVAIIYVISILGLIISFAKNDMVSIMILFAILAISDLISAISGLTSEYHSIELIINDLVYAVVYAYFAYMAMVRFNQSGGKI